MRLTKCLLLWLGWIGVHPALAEDFPYEEVVSRDRTAVRSGPGDDHYATDYLRRGERVEVYRRDDAGWLAIRPPTTSFSWLAQRDVELTEGQSVGKVIGTSAVAWIGSNVESVAEHNWLVKLTEGERISILGQQRQRITPEGRSDLYYKIAPPSGEFRWVHEDDLGRFPEEEIRPEPIRDPEVELADFRVALRGSPRASSSETNAKSSEPRDDFVGRGPASGASSHAPPPKVARLEKRDQAPAMLDSDATDTNGRLRDLERQLSVLVTQPVEKWDFGSLREAAGLVTERALTTLERARVQVFLDKITDFEVLKSRHAVLATAGPSNSQLNVASKTNLANSPATAEPTDPRFDGTGWLLPVHSTKRTAPPFALLDDKGNILQFISPAPGLNLNRYLRKQVGIFGQKEQASTLDKPHLTAQRVVELDRHRR